MPPDQVEKLIADFKSLCKDFDQLRHIIEQRIEQEKEISNATNDALLAKFKTEIAKIEVGLRSHCETQLITEAHSKDVLARIFKRLDDIALNAGCKPATEPSIKQNVEITGTVDGPASGNFSIGFGFFKLAAVAGAGAGILGIIQYVVRFLGGLG